MQQLDVDDEVDIVATLDERLLHATHYLMYRALVRRVRQEVAFGHYSTVILLCDYLIQVRPPSGSGSGARGCRFMGRGSAESVGCAVKCGGRGGCSGSRFGLGC